MTEEMSGQGGGQSTPEVPKTASDPDIEANKLVAALSYLGVLVAVPLFLK